MGRYSGSIQSLPNSRTDHSSRVRQDFYENTPRLEPVKAALDKLQCPVSYNGDLFCVGDVKRVSEQLPGLQACMLGKA